MTFQIVDNIEVPVSTVARTRNRSEFTKALDSLNIGQGFLFTDKRVLKKLYPSVSPKKFPLAEGGSKKFKVWQVVDGAGNAVDGQYGVKRLPNLTAAQAAAAPAGEDGAE